MKAAERVGRAPARDALARRKRPSSIPLGLEEAARRAASELAEVAEF